MFPINSIMSPPQYNWDHASSFQDNFNPENVEFANNTLRPQPSTGATAAVQSSSDANLKGSGRQPRRRDLDWEQHKEQLRSLYLETNKKLDDILQIMQQEHNFTATPKQYKEKFKLWGWQKNLPHDKAQWMVNKANKRKREEQKETVFAFGGLRWTKERAAASAKRAKQQASDSKVIEADTPAGVSYKTPAALNTTSPEAPHDDEDGQAEIISVHSSPDASAAEADIEPEFLTRVWQGFSKTDLDALLGRAKTLHRGGNNVDAESMFLQVLEGYKNVLGATHEDTTKITYEVANFYAQQDRLADAIKILDESTRVHIKQRGIEHRRSWQHVLYLVELLNAWNKPRDALAFLARAKEYVEDGRSGGTGRSRRGKERAEALTMGPPSGGNSRLLDAAHAITSDSSPAQVDIGLELARTYVQAKDGSVEPFLIAILQLCKHDTARFAIQRLRACAELVKLYVKLETIWYNLIQLEEATTAFQAVFTTYEWDKKKFKSLEVMEALLEVAAAVLRTGRDPQASVMFRQATDKAEGLYGPDDERTIWMLISVGLVYQNSRTWSDARQWFDQALAAAMTAFGENDGITRSLEAARENRHFSYLNDEGRPFRTVFGVSGIKITPGRLHLE